MLPAAAAERPECRPCASSPTASTASTLAEDAPSCRESPRTPDAKARRLAKMHARAYSPSDVGLCEAFADLVGVAPDSLASRLLFIRMVRMLHMCDYVIEDIVSILSLAVAHLDTIYAAASCAEMDDAERASVAVLQCYNAHCYLQDEACPLKHWRRNIYGESYCSLKVLNLASMKLFKMLGFRLAVADGEHPRAALLAAADLC